MNADKIIKERKVRPVKIGKKDVWLQHRINAEVKSKLQAKLGKGLSKWLDLKIQEVING